MRSTLLHRALLLGLFGLLCLPATTLAQTAPLNQHTQDYALDSGRHDGRQGPSADLYTAYAAVVEVPGAPWLRLTFRDVDLGHGSYLTVTSRLDGAQQRLDATGIAQWYNTSAYFNGDAVEVALHVAPGDEDVFFTMDEVIVGNHGAPESQCGPTDDRQNSNDPRAGRLLSVGCTGWIIHDEKLVSAGHCLQSGATTLQFNVPLSTGGGTLQHPGPEDQYSVNQASRVFVNGGVGNDWGVFRVFDNTQTGLQPVEAQGDLFALRQDLGPANIRITGFGVDTGEDNQVQQTHVGPNAGSSGTTMRYRTDTTGGNSGSRVIDEATNVAVGVHTHGGCTTAGTGNNSGTSLFNTAFWNAVLPLPPACSLSFVGDVTATVNGAGTSVSFAGTVANAGPGSKSVRLRVAYDGPGATDGALTYGPVNLAPTAGVPFKVNQPIPANAPAGSYALDFELIDNASGTTCATDDATIVLSAPVTGGGTAWVAAPFTFEAASTTAGTAGLVGTYPNPFRATTTVAYALPERADVRLSVYDALGREVAVLVDGALEAGQHQATFDGSGLAGGVYVYRLQAGSQVLTGRLTLVR